MNPFVEFFRDPVGASAVLAYALVLVAALIATWYILGRNLLTLFVRWNKEGWQSPPATWAARAIAVPLILAVDALLFGALVWLLA
ncbi:hypothetical protein [Halomarina rubra]|uniref:Uncharacterized protein n=1 Tax=Halomarina rubra TaxID=2071873 RepID=A0ABD6AT59_9EURY|nr:hypothetical protein [Halomarina rubra]